MNVEKAAYTSNHDDVDVKEEKRFWKYNPMLFYSDTDSNVRGKTIWEWPRMTERTNLSQPTINTDFSLAPQGKSFSSFFFYFCYTNNILTPLSKGSILFFNY